MLISKGHFHRDSYPFIISSCFHIMPDVFTNTSTLPLLEITTKTSFPVTWEFSCSSVQQLPEFKLTLGNRESPVHTVTRSVYVRDSSKK